MLRHIRDTSSSDCPSLDRIFHSSTDLPVVPICRGSTSLISPPNHRQHAAIPSRSEGRIAIVTDAGWDAVDAGGAADESAGLRTAKSCGPDAPTLASSRRSNPSMTVTTKPGHRGEREGNR